MKVIGDRKFAILVAILVVVLSSLYGNYKKPNESYENGSLYYEAGDYEAAITELNQVDAKSRYYKEASAKLDEAVFAFCDDALNRASTYAKEGDYQIACSILEHTLQVVPSNPAITSQLSKYQEAYKEKQRISILEAVDSYINGDDYPSAIQALRAAVVEWENDVEIIALLEKYENMFRQKIISQADSALENEGYTAAINIVNQGLSVLDNDLALTQAIERYETYKPVWLADLDYFDMDAFWGWDVGDITTDNLGNEHKHSVKPCSPYIVGSDSITYKLYGQYSNLEGVFYQLYDYRSDSGEATITFYGDGNLLWQETITKGMEPIDFEVDISGVDIFMIVATPKNPLMVGGDAFYAALGEVALYK